MNKIFKTVVFGAIILAFSGCYQKNTNTQPKSFFLTTKSENLSKSNVTIAVHSHANYLKNTQMWYKKGDKFDYFAIHKWVDLPQNLIENCFLKAGFLDEKSKILARKSIKIDILQMYQDFVDDKSFAVATFKITIIDNTTNKIIISKNLEFAKLCHNATPKSGAEAFGNILSELINISIKELEKYEY